MPGYRPFWGTLLVSLILTTSATAQLKTLAVSPSFEEPRGGFGRLIAEKSGHTAFVYVSGKEGIQVRIYDPEHRELATNTIDPAYGKLKQADVTAIFEGNGQIALFINTLSDGRWILFRFLIDGTTGKLLEEKEIASRSKASKDILMQGAAGTMLVPDFYVRQDPYSGCYAVATCTFNNKGDASDKLEVIHYTSDHHELGRATHIVADRHCRYLDLAVRGDKEVAVLLTGRAGKDIWRKDQARSLLLATLKAGSGKLMVDSLDYPEAASVGPGLIRYNKAGDQYMMLTSHYDNETEGSRNYLSLINPEDHALTLSRLSSSGIQQAADEARKEDRFQEMPQNLYLKEDGSYSVFYEEVLVQNEKVMGSRNEYRTRIILGGLGAVQYTPDGKENGAYYVPRKRNMQFLPDALYYSDRQEKAAQLSMTLQFLYGYYLNGTRQDYLFFNNAEHPVSWGTKRRNADLTMSYEDCIAFSYKVGGAGAVPAGVPTFDRAGSDNKSIGIFQASDYDRERNIMVTLKRAQEGRSSPVQLVWLQPE